MLCMQIMDNIPKDMNIKEQGGRDRAELSQLVIPLVKRTSEMSMDP